METKKLGVFAVILMILTSCLGIRWLPVAGSIGQPALIFWLLGGVLFFIPLAMIVVELANNFSSDGGMYLWVRQALGPKFGFFTAWLYWVNNFFFYPSLLIFMVDNFVYLLADKTLAYNKLFIITIVLVLLWLAIIINILGVRFIAKIAGFACILNISLTVFIIIAGFAYYFMYHTSNTNFYLASFIPNSNIINNLSNLSLLMFALSGVELIPTLASSINKPGKTISKSILISGVILLLCYILGTIGINILVSPQQLNNTTGLIAALEIITKTIHMPYLAMGLVLILLVVEFGALMVWLIAPTVMFFECVEEGIIPKWLQKINKYDAPAHALIVIGIIVTVVLVLTTYLPTVNSIFTTLVLMGTVVYFIPYLFLAISYIKLKYSNKLDNNLINKPLAYLLSIVLFCCVCLGIALSFMPGNDIKTPTQKLIYELNITLGPLVFILIGGIIYYIHYLRKKRIIHLGK